MNEEQITTRRRRRSKENNQKYNEDLFDESIGSWYMQPKKHPCILLLRGYFTSITE